MARGAGRRSLPALKAAEPREPEDRRLQISDISDTLFSPYQIYPPGNVPMLSIQSNSPAFNAGDDANCLSTDERGVSRPAHCSFTVTVFNVCLQDDANPAMGFLGNSSTGEYRFCAGGTVYSGTAAVSRRGNVITFQQNQPDRRVDVTDDEGTFRGSATLQSPVGTIRSTIADRDTRNSVACQ